MKQLLQLFAKAFAWLQSDKGKAALKQAIDLAPQAAPYVHEIAVLSGSRSVDEIHAAFQEYGIPFAEEMLVLGPGPAMLHLASALLSRQFPGVATNIINTAVQIAVTGSQK